MEKVRVIVYGVGRIGSAAIKIMLNRKWLEIAGAIDNDKNKVGRDLGEVVGLDRKLGITVSDDPQTVFQKARAKVVLHTTSLLSYEEAESQILQALEAGLNVISTTDWRLSFPWASHPQWGKRADEVAKKRGVTVLNTGINPGFASDLLPVLYSGACASVRKIKIKIARELSDITPGRAAYLGIGITEGDFRRGLADGTLHSEVVVGEAPQLYLIADALGCKLDEVTRSAEPMTTELKIHLPSGLVIEPGQVCGFRAVRSGVRNKEEVIALEYAIYLKTGKEKYEVETLIEGEPNIRVTSALKAGICTAAHAVNHIPQVLAARPGLVTVRELPVAAAME